MIPKQVKHVFWVSLIHRQTCAIYSIFQTSSDGSCEMFKLRHGFQNFHIISQMSTVNLRFSNADFYPSYSFFILYIYIQGVCVLIFPFHSARYVGVGVERDICCDRGKNRETILSSLQACFVITHSSGDFIVKNIRTIVSIS